MQFLGFPPRAAVAVFPQVFNHQADIFEVPDAGLGVPKPKTLRVLPNQRPRVLDQFRRRRRRGGKIVQGIRPITHGATLRVFPADRKNGGWPWLEPWRQLSKPPPQMALARMEALDRANRITSLKVAFDDPLDIRESRQPVENLVVIVLMGGADAEALSLARADPPLRTGHELDRGVDGGNFSPMGGSVGNGEFVGDRNLPVRRAAQSGLVQNGQVQVDLRPGIGLTLRCGTRTGTDAQCQGGEQANRRSRPWRTATTLRCDHAEHSAWTDLSMRRSLAEQPWK